jgi:hypothetical protein
MAANGEIDAPTEAQVFDNLYEAALCAGLRPPEIARTIRSATRVAA